MLPPGITLGLPIAASPPPGLYFLTHSSFYDAKLYDADGDYAGVKGEASATSFILSWVPGWKLLGGTYRALAVAPLVHVDLTREAPFFPPLLQGQVSKTAWANPLVQPIDISWNLGGGFFASAGIGVYFPLYQWDVDAPLNIDANFWVIEPTLGFTYLNNGWHASLHFMYDHNYENEDIHYRSGDQLFLNATLTRTFGRVTVGPVAYYNKQVTDDVNKGGLAVFGGMTFGNPEQFALGGLISGRVQGIDLQLMYTHDVYTRDAIGGDRYWLRTGLKF